jgi:hypothetical protein
VFTQRIPGFAICARCGSRRALASCQRCGLIVCKDCRGGGECILCYREELEARQRYQRVRRRKQVAHQLGVAACIAATAMAGIGAALLPDPPPPPRQSLVARGEVRFVAQAVERYWDAHGGICPPSLGQLQEEGYLLGPPLDPWGEPLLYGCVESPRSFVILSKGADHLAGTDDDIALALP